MSSRLLCLPNDDVTMRLLTEEKGGKYAKREKGRKKEGEKKANGAYPVELY